MHERDEAQFADSPPASHPTWRLEIRFDAPNAADAAAAAFAAAQLIIDYPGDPFVPSVIDDCCEFVLFNPDNDPVHLAWDTLTPDSGEPDETRSRRAA